MDLFNCCCDHLICVTDEKDSWKWRLYSEQRHKPMAAVSLTQMSRAHCTEKRNGRQTPQPASAATEWRFMV